MRAAELLEDNENKPAPGELRFVQAFVNSLDVRSGADRFASPQALAQWLSRHGNLPPDSVVGDADHRRAIEVREALRELLATGELEADARAALEEAGRRGAVRFEPVGSAIELTPLGSGVDAALGELLTIVYRSMVDGTWERLKACTADDCRWAFYDASRNRSGAWCSMETCGNRAKVREHRSRQRGA